MPMTTSNPNLPAICQWDIWQVNWHHEDGTSKPRPALILSSSAYARANASVWVAKFTKTCVPNTPFMIQFDKSDPTFPETGLTESCCLYIAECRKIDASLLIHRRGRLPIITAGLIGALMKQALKFRIP
jgi:mRNA-degrading endonuclease toxin of MazEF toxin-antitoxin module